MNAGLYGRFLYCITLSEMNYRDVVVAAENRQSKRNVPPIEVKQVVIKASSESDANGEHSCLLCGSMFKCVGVLPTKPSWCCQCEQAPTTSGIVFWCSYACEREYNNNPTDSDEEDAYGDWR